MIVDAARTPIRAGIAASDLGLAVGALALGLVKQALGEEGYQPVEPITDILPLRGAIRGANRVEELTQPDRALGRMLARGGPADKLTRPGGVVDMLSEPGGLLDRISLEGSSLERILEPGGLVDRLLDEDGPLERMFAEDGMIERLFAEDGMIERLFAEEGMIERLFAEEGIVDKLTAKNGPLEQLTEAAEILSQLQPVVETLTPTAETLQSGVDRLNRVATSMTTFTDRLPGRRAARAVTPKRGGDDGGAEE
jgi:hypothetical protein